MKNIKNFIQKLSVFGGEIFNDIWKGVFLQHNTKYSDK